jgi:chemotaxis protein methyltransferase CheR
MKNLLRKDDEREFAFSERDFSFIAGLVSKRTGIMLSENKKNMVYSRLARRLRVLGFNTFSQYCELIQSSAGDEEMGNLVNAITTNLTSFFREGHHFEHLRNNVLLPLAASAPKPKRLRIWSAGCSAGMESYSIALTIKYALKDLSKWDAKILATDIDTNMLDIGRSGEYSVEQLEKIPASYRSDIRSIDDGERIIMSEDLREIISFKQLNLLEKWPMSGIFDAVFCRNVVIYFDKPTQKVLFDRIADLIKPDGWLYIGHSENLHNVCDRFEPLGHTVYRKIR